MHKMETMKNLPLMQRPREKLLHFGPAALSNKELIAILLGTGSYQAPLTSICDELIAAMDNRPQRLATMGIEQFCKIKGIGEVKAIILVAAMELGKRSVCIVGQPLALATFDQVAAFLSPYLPRQESAGYFLVMCNNHKELLATQEFAIDEYVPPRVNTIIRAALAAGAADIVLCRSPFDLPDHYLDKEKAMIIQLDAVASMVNMNMRGLFVVDTVT